MKTDVETKPYTWIFIDAVFIIPKNWRQHKWWITDQWKYKMWYIHTIEYYLAIKKSEILMGVPCRNFAKCKK